MSISDKMSQKYIYVLKVYPCFVNFQMLADLGDEILHRGEVSSIIKQKTDYFIGFKNKTIQVNQRQEKYKQQTRAKLQTNQGKQRMKNRSHDIGTCFEYIK